MSKSPSNRKKKASSDDGAGTVTTEPAVDVKVSASKEEKSELEILRARIAELESENERLKNSKQSSRSMYFTQATNLYDNLNELQVKLKEQLKDSINDGILRLGQITLDLKPWVEAAAKSRKIDPSIIVEGIDRKKRQLLVCLITFLMLPMSILTTVAWAIYGLFFDKSRVVLGLLLVYAAYMYFDRRYEMGSISNEWLKRHIFWKTMGNYFPCLLMKQNPDTVFDPKGLYMFGYHPHGIISVGCFVSFAADATGFSDMFPGINVRPATLETNFYVPFWRELLLRLGVISVSERSIRNVLKKGPGNAVLVVPGGAAEALDARPGTHSLTLNKRQGFFRIALQHGASLVPIYSFGENDLYVQAGNEEGTLLRRIQDIFLKYAGFATPFFSGAGSTGTAIPMNPIPSRVPIITIVGDPIMVPLIADPTNEDIQKIRFQYIAKLQEMFAQFADTYAPERKSNLKIVK
jgi:2-acylglycerol O-acyltransferase 2